MEWSGWYIRGIAAVCIYSSPLQYESFNAHKSKRQEIGHFNSTLSQATATLKTARGGGCGKSADGRMGRIGVHWRETGWGSILTCVLALTVHAVCVLYSSTMHSSLLLHFTLTPTLLFATIFLISQISIIIRISKFRHESAARKNNIGNYYHGEGQQGQAAGSDRL